MEAYRVEQLEIGVGGGWAGVEKGRGGEGGAVLHGSGFLNLKRLRLHENKLIVYMLV